MGHVEDEDQRYEKFFQALENDPEVIRVGYIYVDVVATIERRSVCSEGLCMQQGCGEELAGKTCCTTFNVPLETQDVERIARIVDEVREIRDVDEAICDAEGWWRHEEDGLYLEDQPDGSCVFLSAVPGGRPLCTIHEWALANGFEFRDYKPETCCLFPLYMAQHEHLHLVTGYGSRLMLEFDADEEGKEEEVHEFVCLQPPPGQGRSLLVEQKEELEYRLGKSRWGRVLEHLRRLGHPV